MITRIAPRKETPAWRRELAAAITDPATLIEALSLPPSLAPEALTAHRDFRLRAPRGFVARMEPGNPRDPLLLQILPQTLEAAPSPPGYSPDPVGDLPASRAPGLIHKYAGRALLIASPACAVHCRYCFRRQYPYAESINHPSHWRKALAYLESTPAIEEVILSGGDPLMLTDDQLAPMIAALEAIPHLKTLRIHSRLPVVIPARIDNDQLRFLDDSRLRVVMVIHANHPAEIDAALQQALRQLARRDIALFNQSVLLKGVNDDASVLARLSRRLFDSRVQPYYLHLLDRVTGAAHFEVDEATARRIHTELSARLPGYLLPRLVRDIPDRPAKTTVT